LWWFVVALVVVCRDVCGGLWWFVVVFVVALVRVRAALHGPLRGFWGRAGENPAQEGKAIALTNAAQLGLLPDQVATSSAQHTASMALLKTRLTWSGSGCPAAAGPGWGLAPAAADEDRA
jgi:hypothetical protein